MIPEFPPRAFSTLFAPLSRTSYALTLRGNAPPTPPSSATFDAAVAEFNPLLVEFYAPWCGHCKSLAPEYAKAAGELLPKGLRIAKVDATVEKKVAGRFEIQGFPTLKFFRGSAESPSEFGGGRTAKDIVAWVTKKSAPATQPVATVEEFKALAAGDSVAFLLLGASDGSELAKSFSSVASSTEGGVAFATAFGAAGAALRKEYGVGADEDAVVGINNFEDQANAVTMAAGETTVEAVSAFVAANSLPLVVPFSPSTAQKIFAGSIKTHFLLFASPENKKTKALLDSMRSLSKANAGELLFVSVDPKGESNDKILSFFGVADSALPTAAIIKMADEGPKKFLLGEPATAASLATFLDNYKSGAIKTTLKSAPEPAPDASSDVRVLVGTTFESQVINGPEDISIVEFYAPWCGHCKALVPTWEKLATKFKGDAKVGIFKMDYTENEVDFPGVSIKGFPTVRWVTPLVYTGRSSWGGGGGGNSAASDTQPYPPPLHSPQPPPSQPSPQTTRPPLHPPCRLLALSGQRPAAPRWSQSTMGSASWQTLWTLSPRMAALLLPRVPLMRTLMTWSSKRTPHPPPHPHGNR